jgi:hypothetical protein
VPSFISISPHFLPLSLFFLRNPTHFENRTIEKLYGRFSISFCTSLSESYMLLIFRRCTRKLLLVRTKCSAWENMGNVSFGALTLRNASKTACRILNTGYESKSACRILNTGYANITACRILNTGYASKTACRILNTGYASKSACRILNTGYESKSA